MFFLNYQAWPEEAEKSAIFFSGLLFFFFFFPLVQGLLYIALEWLESDVGTRVRRFYT